MAKRPTDAKIEAWTRLVRAGQSVLSAVEADLKAAGFPPLAWYDALLELNRAEGDGLRPFELQQRMLLAQYNLSRLADRLEAAGYVERRPCEEDGRGHVVVITRQGRALLRRMWPAYAAAIEAHLGAKLSDQEAAALSRTLGKLVARDRP